MLDDFKISELSLRWVGRVEFRLVGEERGSQTPFSISRWIRFNLLQRNCWKYVSYGRAESGNHRVHLRTTLVFRSKKGVHLFPRGKAQLQAKTKRRQKMKTVESRISKRQLFPPFVPDYSSCFQSLEFPGNGSGNQSETIEHRQQTTILSLTNPAAAPCPLTDVLHNFGQQTNFNFLPAWWHCVLSNVPYPGGHLSCEQEQTARRENLSTNKSKIEFKKKIDEKAHFFLLTYQHSVLRFISFCLEFNNIFEQYLDMFTQKSFDTFCNREKEKHVNSLRFLFGWQTNVHHRFASGGDQSEVRNETSASQATYTTQKRVVKMNSHQFGRMEMSFRLVYKNNRFLEEINKLTCAGKRRKNCPPTCYLS